MILEYIDCANCYDRGVLNFPKILRDTSKMCKCIISLLMSYPTASKHIRTKFY